MPYVAKHCLTERLQVCEIATEKIHIICHRNIKDLYEGRNIIPPGITWIYPYENGPELFAQEN